MRACVGAPGDDLSGVDRDGIVSGLRALQRPSGAFAVTACVDECDMRFLYCACVISAFLGDWSGVDTAAAKAFIKSCIVRAPVACVCVYVHVCVCTCVVTR